MSLKQEDGEEEYQVWCYLMKKGTFGRVSWRKYAARFYRKNEELKFFNDMTETTPRAEFDVGQCFIYDVVDTLRKPCSIKIQCRDVDKMKMELECIGGVFKGLEEVSKKKKKKKKSSNSEIQSPNDAIFSRLEKTPFSRWTEDDILSWLNLFQFDENCKESLKKRDINTGQDLLRNTETGGLEELDIEKEDVSKLSCLVRLSSIVGFSKPIHTVALKLIQFKGFHGSEIGNPSSSDFENLVTRLCEHVFMKHYYLTSSNILNPRSPNFPKIKKFFDVSQEEVEGEEEEEDEHVINYYSRKVEYLHRMKLRVKLIITEMQYSSSESSDISQLSAPFVACSREPKPPFSKYFKTAILVGPWYFEWSESGLVIPRRTVYSMPLIVNDVETFYVKRRDYRYPLMTDDISKLITRYNTSYQYSEEETGKRPRNGRNSYDFVLEMLELLGVNMPSIVREDTSMGKFLAVQKKFGKSKMEFRMSEEFMNYFKEKIEKHKSLNDTAPKWYSEEEISSYFDSGVILFESHEQIDRFSAFFTRTCFEITELFSEDLMLLKSFDRIFWLRHLNDTKNPKSRPRAPAKIDMSEFSTGCPFRDPRECVSFF